MQLVVLDAGDPIVAARCGDLYDEITRYAWRFAARGGYDRNELESDALFGLLQAARIWDGRGVFARLAFTVAKRRMLDGLRSRRAYPTETVDHMADVHVRSDYLAVVEALRSLPALRAEVLVRRLRGETNAEIATAMGINETRVVRIATAYGEPGRVLTPAELRILELTAQGMNRPKIAFVLHVSDETVKTHVTSLRRKLGATTIGHAVAIALRDGLIE